MNVMPSNEIALMPDAIAHGGSHARDRPDSPSAPAKSSETQADSVSEVGSGDLDESARAGEETVSHDEAEGTGESVTSECTPSSAASCSPQTVELVQSSVVADSNLIAPAEALAVSFVAVPLMLHVAKRWFHAK
ncbi:MAG: hypothetical protein AAFX40_02435 [Cyanobacteria bacterium J06639_1]